jgi:hypothetical protein
MALTWLELTDIKEDLSLQNLTTQDPEDTSHDDWIMEYCEDAEARFIAFASSLGVVSSDIPERESLSRFALDCMIWDVTWRILFDINHMQDEANREDAKWKAAKAEYSSALQMLNYNIITNTSPTTKSFTIPRYN